MHRGYVKLWRRSFDSQVWANPDLWRFWTWCLMKASHKHITETIGFQQIHLNPGEFVFGRKAASIATSLSVQTVRTCLKSLNHKKLTIKSTNKYSIISIINWDRYQSDDSPINHQANKRLTIKQPASNHQVTTNKNYKNVKNVKEKKKKTYSADFLSWYGVYPNKKDKDDAWKAWQQRNGDRPPVEQIIAAVEKQIKEKQELINSGKFCPQWKNPGRWLRAGCWNDQTEPECTKTTDRRAELREKLRARYQAEGKSKDEIRRLLDGSRSV